jgi:hypothetical protein
MSSKKLNQNQLKKLQKMFNETLDAIRNQGDQYEELGKPNPTITSHCYRVFFIQDKLVKVFKQDTSRKLEKAINEFWSVNQELYSTVSKKKFRECIDNLIAECLETGTNSKFASIAKIYEELLGLEVEEIEVFRPLYGIPSGEKSIYHLTPFTIYKYDVYHSLMENKGKGDFLSKVLEDYKATEDMLGNQNPEKSPLLENIGIDVISVKVNSRDFTKAIELAEAHFYQLENIISYIFSEEDIDICITSPLQRLTPHTICLSSNGASARIINDQNYPFGDYLISPFLSIDHPFLYDGKIENNQLWEYQGHPYIWEALAAEEPSDLQKRILAAVEWVGKAAKDKDPARKLTQIMIGLESLLSSKGKGGISSLLAEYTAFLIGDDLEDRKHLENTVKKLYNERSDIAHGSSSNAHPNSIADALWIVKSVIKRITTDPVLKELSDFNKLKEWITHKKYSN